MQGKRREFQDHPDPGTTHINGAVNTALHPCTLQHQPRLPTQSLLNPFRHLLRPHPTLDRHSPHPRHQPPRHLQPRLIQIRNNNRRCASRMRRQQTHQPNWSRATNYQRIAQSQSRPLYARQSDRKRFEHRPFFKTHTIRKPMQPRSRVRVVPSQSAVDRWRGEEHHVGTCVVLARAAGRTAGAGARDAVFEGYAVACEDVVS